MQSLNNIAAITRVVIDERQKRAIIVGLIAQMMATRANGGKRLAAGLQTIVGAIAADKIKLYFDRHGVFVGYITWATVSPDVENRLLTEPHLDLSGQERSSGASLWITDCVITGKHLLEVLEDLRDKQFVGFQEISYFRVKGQRRIAKRVSRASGHTFFRSTPRTPMR